MPTRDPTTELVGKDPRASFVAENFLFYWLLDRDPIPDISVFTIFEESYE